MLDLRNLLSNLSTIDVKYLRGLLLKLVIRCLLLFFSYFSVMFVLVRELIHYCKYIEIQYSYVKNKSITKSEGYNNIISSKFIFLDVKNSKMFIYLPNTHFYEKFNI